MEPTKFNLGQSIDNYIQVKNNQGSITGSDKSELTAHLYDATEALKKSGLSEEEAFIIASKRLGSDEVIAGEYSKVNASVATNKIWLFLWLGFVALSVIPQLAFNGITLFYWVIYNTFGDSAPSTMILVSFHLCFVFLMGCIVRYKTKISWFIEKQSNLGAFRVIAVSLLPVVLLYCIRPMMYRLKLEGSINHYPMYVFQNDYIEFKFYMAALSIVVLLCLLLSFNGIERISLRSLFEKPSIKFLLILGFLTELAASGTRPLNHHGVMAGVVFGMVYFLPSVLIVYYNINSRHNRYLAIFAALGIFIETTFGIAADLTRGGTHYTVYFVCGLIAGVIAGRFLGLKLGNKSQVQII